MNIHTSITPSEFRRSPLVALGFLVVFVVAAYEFAQFVINDDLIGLAYVAMALVMGAFVIGMLKNWRNGLYFFVVWLLFEDFARKFLGNNMAIYFAKDFLVAIVYLSFFVAYRRKQVQTFRPPFLVPLLIFIWFGVMQVFNPASSTVIYGVLGMKLFFAYVPLLFVGYALLNSETELRRFFFVNVCLAVIIGGLGIAQAILGPTFLNPEVVGEDIRLGSTLYRLSSSGLLAHRPSSVFVSTGRYADYLLVCWLLSLGFAGYVILRKGRGRNFVFISVAVLAAAIVLSTSRGVFSWSAGSLIAAGVAFVWGAPWRQRQVMRVSLGVLRAGLGVVLALVLLSVIFPDALASRVAIYSETLLPGQRTSEIGIRTWDYPVRNFLGAFDGPRWPYGYGLGTTALGTQYVARIFHAAPLGWGVESGFGTIVVEMGIGGLALWLIMSLSIIFAAWKVVKKLKGTPWFPLSFVIFWYALLLLFPMTFAGMQAYEDFVMNAYLWLLLGILFRLPTLTPSPGFEVAGTIPDCRQQLQGNRL
ncbi:MAG TPA: hypothetical protein VOA64_15635 [Candidatus Dormibacteraeota bacterium]|nr:hypothetical protein [Candidatus Dormibacteraeota bacterium]